MPRLDDIEAYISVDVEASGPVPGKYSMLSVGACLVEDPSKEFYCEIKPISPEYIEEALKVTGFSLEKLAAEGETPVHAMQRLSEWTAMVSDGREPVLVVKAYYMGKAAVRWRETKSSKLPLQLTLPRSPSENHNALADAKYQAEVFSRLIARA
jgi:ribonuclease T